MTILDKLLITDKINICEKITILQYATRDSNSISLMTLNKVIADIEWESLSFYTAHHLMCILSVLGSKYKHSSTKLEPSLNSVCLVAKKPSINRWNNLTQSSAFKLKTLTYKISVLSMFDTIPNFWSNVKVAESNTKLCCISEIIKPVKLELNVLNSLGDGLFLFEQIHNILISSSNVHYEPISEGIIF